MYSEPWERFGGKILPESAMMRETKTRTITRGKS
jgi:hypothetical protein